MPFWQRIQPYSSCNAPRGKESTHSLRTMPLVANPHPSCNASCGKPTPFVQCLLWQRIYITFVHCPLRQRITLNYAFTCITPLPGPERVRTVCNQLGLYVLLSTPAKVMRSKMYIIFKKKVYCFTFKKKNVYCFTLVNVVLLQTFKVEH